MTKKLAKEKPPAFQFYPKDYLGSQRVAVLSLEEEGAYCRAMFYCWLHGSLPNDAVKVARLIGKNCTVEIAQSVMQFFRKKSKKSDEIIHERLEKERVKQKEFSSIRSKAGMAGALSRWQTDGKRHSFAMANAMAKNGFASASSSSSSEENKIKKIAVENFLKDQAWQEQFCMTKGISLQELQTLQAGWISDVELKGEFVKNYKQYFTNWFNKNRQNGVDVSENKSLNL